MFVEILALAVIMYVIYLAFFEKKVVSIES